MSTGFEQALLRPSGVWQRMLNYFVPPATSNDREAYNQAKMFLISHLLGPFLGGTVPIALYFLDPTPGLEIAVLAASILSFWLFPFLLRAGVVYHRLVLLSIAIDWFVIYWSCYFYGGVSSPTLVWLLIIPILSLFYVGGERRYHTALLKISALSSAIFFGAYVAIEPPVNDVPHNALLALGATSTVATLCYVAMMAVYYARIFDAGVVLEIEVRRRRQMAEELRKAIVHTHRVGSAKAEFLARMSHEIRTPLNAIIGYGQLVREEAEDCDDDLLLEDVDRILDAARYLVRLINMILDLAKIGAGRMRFDCRASDVSEILELALAERQAAIDQNGNTATIEVEAALGSVEVDRHRLAQILDCLLENAARHTRGGSIILRAGRSSEAGGERFFFVSVRDTGAGISPDTMATLFESFATARNAADGRYGGTGLSLTLCSQLCRAMGGSIAVTSRPGEGSTFTVRLPEAPALRQPDVRAEGNADAAAA